MHLSCADGPAQWAAPSQDPIWRRAEDLGACLLSFGPAEQQPAVEPIIAQAPLRAGGPGTPGRRPVRAGASRISAPQRPDLAQYPSVYVRFTPQAARGRSLPVHGPARGLRADLRRFGPRRLMWGTDFPHIFADIRYARGMELFRDYMAFPPGRTSAGCSRRPRRASGSSAPKPAIAVGGERL